MTYFSIREEGKVPQNSLLRDNLRTNLIGKAMWANDEAIDDSLTTRFDFDYNLLN